MNDHEDKISLEVKGRKGEYEVFMYLNEAALEALIEDLKRMKNSSDHVHYMSDEWGVGTLSTDLIDDRNNKVHHLKITRI